MGHAITQHFGHEGLVKTKLFNYIVKEHRQALYTFLKQFLDCFTINVDIVP